MLSDGTRRRCLLNGMIEDVFITVSHISCREIEIERLDHERRVPYVILFQGNRDFAPCALCELVRGKGGIKNLSGTDST